MVHGLCGTRGNLEKELQLQVILVLCKDFSCRSERSGLKGGESEDRQGRG